MGSTLGNITKYNLSTNEIFDRLSNSTEVEFPENQNGLMNNNRTYTQ